MKPNAVNTTKTLELEVVCVYICIGRFHVVPRCLFMLGYC